MKILFPLFLLFTGTLQAQYYYNDIIGTKETTRQMQVYNANKVRTVTAKGVDSYNRAASDFSEFQEIKDNGRTLKITSFTNGNRMIYFNRFDEQGRLKSITDSSGDVQNITTYEYDEAGRISRVLNRTKDSANDFTQDEVHQYIYGNTNNPVKMWRIINGHDSTEVRFSPDENGNTGDERSFKRGIESGVVYYYYDDKNRLSDIVRYNTRLKKLMPDIMFEYDESDRVIQRITTTSALHLNYLIWRYIYDEKGLKSKEALFNNDKELTGRIEYAYVFGG
jgi:antitoxin component YwqK of YwqJK toxin-antitoxin module